MPRETGVPDVLSRAEQALFHGPPDQALGVLELARNAPGARTRLGARWLTGVALGSLGRYGQALAELEPLLAAAAPGAAVATPEERLFAGHAAATPLPCCGR
ncbi:MAG: hypothetical protein ACXV5Q_07240 [Frankiaceae bacterium]